MEGDREHEGWTNFETWIVNMDIIQNERNLNLWTQAAATCTRTAQGNTTAERTYNARVNLADLLKNHYEIWAETRHSLFALDLINAALGRVDWQEIAGNLLAK